MSDSPRFLALLSVGLVCSCYQGGEGDDATAGTEGTDASSSASVTATTQGTASTSGASTTSASATATATATTTGETATTDLTDTAGTTTGPDLSVCERWNADRADLSEGTWSGDVGSCDPGDISAEGRANALKIMNLYRFMADLPPVTTSPERDQQAQACALLMHANGSLSHSPPMTWNCYSADGSAGAGKSNIAGTAGVAAVDLYMVDPGNPTTMGHRRWILSNSIGPTGLGSTNGYSCMWTLGGNGNAGKEWTAWPPPGTFPLGAVQPSWSSIDETGWTIQSDSIDLASAQVSITRDGQDLPVSITSLAGGYGSSSAISMIPQGWTTVVGQYHVEVTGVGTPISYDIDVVTCE